MENYNPTEHSDFSDQVDRQIGEYDLSDQIGEAVDEKLDDLDLTDKIDDHMDTIVERVCTAIRVKLS